MGSVPDCPKCASPMVKRTAKKGANAGREFWGCSTFPRCRSVVPCEPVAASVGEETTVGASPREDAEASTSPGLIKRADGLLTKVAQTIDKGYRWYLETDEPDATGRWDKNHRRKVLAYIYDRDSGRCGLCAGEMKREGAQIEHIVPKVFASFDVRKGGKAEPGKRYTSRLHKLDNLQAAHTYCNKRKGNTADVKKWRHPAMPSLVVADTEDGKTFALPWSPKARTGG